MSPIIVVRASADDDVLAAGQNLPKEMKYLQNVIDAQVKASEEKPKNGKQDLMQEDDDE